MTYRSAVKVSRVRTSTRSTVTLLFDSTGVHVLERPSHRGALYLPAGAALFAAMGLAALGLGLTHAVSALLGQGVAIGAVVIAAAGVVLAGAAWVLATRAEQTVRCGGGTPTIPVDSVAWARSEQQGGLVTVTLGTTGGATPQFSASGTAGKELARHFAELLGVAQPAETPAAVPPDGPAPS